MGWGEPHEHQQCPGTRALALLVATLAMAMLLTGCSSTEQTNAAPSSDEGPAERGGTVVVAVAKEPPILNYWLAPGAMAIAQQLTDGLSDPLVALDQDGHWQPALATSVPTLKNGGVVVDPTTRAMTVSFAIHRDAFWSDNVPITCDDVAFTWKTATNPKYQIATRLGWEAISDVSCPSSKEVRIRFAGTYALFLSRIMAFPPLPAHALKGKDFNTFWNERISISSGPFVFDSWQRGVRLVIKRNENYWRSKTSDQTVRLPNGAPYLDRVVFRFVKDANTLKMQLRMKEADVAFIPADTNLATELKATPDINFAILPGAVMELLVLRSDKPPLNDVRIRQALAHAIDRKMITKVILSGVVNPASGPMVTTQAPLYRDSPLDRYDKPSPSKVRDLLQSAGYVRPDAQGMWTRGGKPLTLTWVAGAGSMPFRAKVAQLVQEQLRRQGIGIEIRLIPSEVLYSHVAPHGQFDLGEWSELTGAEPLPSLIYGCSEIPKKPSWTGKNRAAWCNTQADQLMKKADQTVDTASRAKIVAHVNRIIATEVPVLPLFQSPDVIAWRSTVHGLSPNPTSNHTWNMDKWWVSS